MSVPIPLPTGAYEARSKNINAQRLQNWYSVIDKGEGSKKPVVLVGTPGMTSRVTPAADVEVRGAHAIGNELFMVCGATLYEIDTDWNATSRGTLDSSTGFLCMTDDKTWLKITDGTSGYTFNTSTNAFAKITDGDYVGGGSCCFQDGYFISSKPSDQTIQISTANNPTAYAALEVRDAQKQGDDVTRIISDGHNLWCFGEKSTEPWYYTPNLDFPYANVPGKVLDKGIAGVGGVILADGRLCFLSNKREVYVIENFQPVKVSTPGIHYQLSELSSVTDVVTYTYTMEGNTFVVFQFPSADKTFVYNLDSTRWHTWASWATTAGDTTLNNRHRSNCYADFNGFHVVGDHSNGKVLTLHSNVYKDDTNLVRRIAGFPTIQNTESNKDIQMYNFTVEFEPGVGLDAGAQGSDPQVFLRMSYDNGHTYGYEQWRGIGQIGEKDHECRWNKLGSAPSFTPEIVMTDPVKPIIVGAYGDVRGLSR